MAPHRVSNPTSSENAPIEQAEWPGRFEAQLGREFRGLKSVLLAVSGGADSMAMLVAAARLRLPCEVATVDHGARPGSDADAALVERTAVALGLRCHLRRLSLGAGPGFEARARQARYGALKEVAMARGLALVATAHTATDQAETVLMRLVRGASAKGASGVQRHRADGVVRPLLWATRADTQRYCSALSIEVAHDAMNDDPSFLRTRLRHGVLPALREAAGPTADLALSRFAALVADDDAWLANEANRALERAARGDALDALAIRATGRPIRRRALACWLDAQGLSVDHALLDDVLRAVDEGRTATLPNDRLLTVSGGALTVRPAPPRLHGTSSSDDGRSRK